MILTAPGLPTIPTRIVSLVPSQTELLYFLGLNDSTIAITKFCVHPPEWHFTKTIIGGTKNININKIEKLQPDLIIANKEENVKEQVEELSTECSVWLTDVNSFLSALKMINDIGKLTGKINEAQNLSLTIQQKFDTIPSSSQKINTAYFIWRNPYMAVGGDTFINDMLCYCGLQNIFADKARYPSITIDEIKQRNCRLVLLSSEPYPFKQKHIGELQAQIPGIKILLVNGEMFSWYGSRLLYAADYFKELIATINI